jgi:hypothetical protein
LRASFIFLFFYQSEPDFWTVGWIFGVGGFKVRIFQQGTSIAGTHKFSKTIVRNPLNELILGQNPENLNFGFLDQFLSFSKIKKL